MSLRHIVSRIAVPHHKVAALSLRRSQVRSLSTQGEVAVEKLRNALEEYRQKNYTQTLRSRFTKDIVRAAKETESDNTIALNGMQRVLSNIEMQDKISAQEMEIIFREMGDTSGTITADRMMKMI